MRMMVTLMMVSVLVSCRVGPNYVKPMIDVPDSFRGADQAASADSASLADLKWFEVFKDEQLQQLILTALEENYDLRDAVVRVDAARANVGITRANQFPSVTVGNSSHDVTHILQAEPSRSFRELSKAELSVASLSTFSLSKRTFGADSAARPMLPGRDYSPPKRTERRWSRH